MADKYLSINGNGLQEEREGKTASAGAADSGKIPALNASGKLDETLMPDGVGADANSANAFENLGANSLVYIKSDGTLALAFGGAGGNAAQAFVKTAVTAGNPVTYYFDGTMSDLTGKTPGKRQFLSATTPGAMTETPPIGAGEILQSVGFAIDAASVSFEEGEPVLRA